MNNIKILHYYCVIMNNFDTACLGKKKICLLFIMLKWKCKIWVTFFSSSQKWWIQNDGIISKVQQSLAEIWNRNMWIFATNTWPKYFSVTKCILLHLICFSSRFLQINSHFKVTSHYIFVIHRGKSDLNFAFYFIIICD